MGTTTDVYVKFGESGGTGPNGTPLPAIEGDSTDELHYWWCELRDCGFDLEAAELGAEAGGGAKKKDHLTVFKPVTLKKRLDWASTSLFQLCCDAAEAKVKKLDPDSKKGVLDKVTVEICRPGGGDKFPFLVIEYSDVKVTHFKIGMSGPEASEEVTFEFGSLKYKYQQTNPYTGERKGSSTFSAAIKNQTQEQEKQQQNAMAGSGSGGPSGPAPSAPPAGPGAPVPSNAPHLNGSPAPASVIENIAGVTFPGFRGPGGVAVER